MPESVLVGESAEITVLAHDPAGNPLSYIWTAPHGEFHAQDGDLLNGPVPYSTVTFEAPDFPMDVNVKVTVKNDQCVVSDMLVVPVVNK
jgi:hypothetical protein